MNAKDYKKLASQKRTEEVLHDVPVPSGGVWKMREPPIEQWVLAGKLPGSLVSKMAAAAGTNGDLDAAKKGLLQTLKPEDLLNSLEFGRDLLLYCAVEPRIKMDADPESETEIAPEDILPEDFPFLINWVLTGGKTGESLESFRSE
jgi:hypothetical protein